MTATATLNYDSNTTYIMEANKSSAGNQPVVLRAIYLDLRKEISSATSQETIAKTLACFNFCLKAGT